LRCLKNFQIPNSQNLRKLRKFDTRPPSAFFTKPETAQTRKAKPNKPNNNGLMAFARFAFCTLLVRPPAASQQQNAPAAAPAPSKPKYEVLSSIQLNIACARFLRITDEWLVCTN
jgi:hypothetical protein